MANENPNQGNQGATNANLARLESMIGFDCTKEAPTKEAFSKALENITKKRNEKLQTRVEEQLERAMGLAQQKAKNDKEYRQQDQKWNKEMGKVLTSLQAMSTGKEPPPPEEEKKDAAETAAS